MIYYNNYAKNEVFICVFTNVHNVVYVTTDCDNTHEQYLYQL